MGGLDDGEGVGVGHVLVRLPVGDDGQSERCLGGEGGQDGGRVLVTVLLAQLSQFYFMEGLENKNVNETSSKHLAGSDRYLEGALFQVVEWMIHWPELDDLIEALDHVKHEPLLRDHLDQQGSVLDQVDDVARHLEVLDSSPTRDEVLFHAP